MFVFVFVLLLLTVEIADADQNFLQALNSSDRCGDGQFLGYRNVDELLPAFPSHNCSSGRALHPKSVDLLWSTKCLMRNLNVVELDGSLNTSNLDNFLHLIYSPAILNDVPQLRTHFKRCAKENVSGGLHVPMEALQQAVEVCFDKNAHMYRKDLKRICWCCGQQEVPFN